MISDGTTPFVYTCLYTIFLWFFFSCFKAFKGMILCAVIPIAGRKMRNHDWLRPLEGCMRRSMRKRNIPH